MGVPVSRGQLQPGDLVFFDGLGHVGIYVGGGSFIHAPHTGDVVKISSIGELVRVDVRRGAPHLRAADRLATVGLDGRTGKAGTASEVGIASDALVGARRIYLARVELSISSAKCSSTTRRLSFSVGVTSLCSSEKSRDKDREALDLLVARALAVDLVDRLAWIARTRVSGAISVVAALAGPLRDLGLVERDQRGDVRPAVADDERLRDVPRRLERRSRCSAARRSCRPR